MSPRPAVTCREMAAADVEAVATMMAEAFCWPCAHWRQALEAMRTRESPEGYPRFGYVLEQDGALAGAILTIFATVRQDGKAHVRCNVSSWYVAPAARGHGMLLTRKVLQHRDVVLVDVSPMPHTRRFIESCGFQRYTQGQFACLPALRLSRMGARVRPYRAQDALALADAEEASLLADHARYGCLSVAVEADGALTPFVFSVRRLSRTPLTQAQLIYCRDTADFVRFAGPLGRFLLRRRAVLATLDGDGPVRGLPGRFLKDRWPRYYRGDLAPRPNDLAYTEAVVLGV